jgi:hypothetical protein
MRRAEKAGREDARDVVIDIPGDVDLGYYARQYLTDIVTPSQALVRAVGREPAAKYIGARNVNGKAWQEALKAYDRGYYAVLKSYLASLDETKGIEQ